MLCLFRNSLIHPRLDPAAIALSWIGTLYWLYFAFIEKALFDKITAGHALIVDLVFGLPLVFAVAIMIYATIYWGIKAVLATVFPMALVPKETGMIFEEDMGELENQYGDDYWDSKEQAATENKLKTSNESQAKTKEPPAESEKRPD